MVLRTRLRTRAPEDDGLAVDGEPRPDVVAPHLDDAPPGRLARLRGWQPTSSQVLTFMLVAGSVLFTLAQLQPRPLIASTTANGGDMGAHVWQPAFLRDHLLPHGRLTGWAPDWYAGFPALVFYFPLPSLMTVILSVFVHYNVAFKLVTVSGVLSLPVCAYFFAK